MRHFKQIASAVTALAMTAALAVPMTASLTVSAADYTITVSNAEGSDFAGYRLLDVTVNADKTAYTYKVNATYRTILANALSVSLKDSEQDRATADIDNDILTALQALDGNTAGMRTFADAVYKAIQASGNSITPDVTATANDDGVITIGENLGYYLLVETNTNGSTRSLVVVDTADDANTDVELKKDAPVFDKEILDANDSGTETGDIAASWKDSADHDIGDKVQFRMTATLPDNLASYSNGYKMVFHDNFRDDNNKEVFTFDSATGIKTIWVDVDGNGVYNAETDVVIPAKGNPNTYDLYYVLGGSGESSVAGMHGEEDFTITIFDLTKIGKDLTFTQDATATVVIEYEATLNENAVIGAEGNWNEAYLSYSNNPYWEKSGDTTEGDEEEDENNTTTDSQVEAVVTFTYKVIVDKVRPATGSEQGNQSLNGATFALQKYVKSGQTYSYYDDQGELKTATAQADGYVTIQTIKGTASAQFTFSGLDAGKYKIVETEAPEGYTKGDDIEFEIRASHTDNGASSALTKLEVYDSNGNLIGSSDSQAELDSEVFDVELSDGSLEVEVLNTTTSKLPSTGGMGTVLFYVIGGILVAGAGVTLITRKRMEEE